MPAARVGFVTVGCPKNEVDSDRMAAAAQGAGYAVVDDLAEAEVAVINTCSFIREATEESIATVLDAAREWLPAGENRHLVVAGCMPSRYGADLAASMPEVSAFVPVAEEDAILDVLARLVGPARKAGAAASPHASCPSRTASGPWAYLQVSDGCHRRCAYCTIPAIRGPYRSRRLPEIVAEAGELVSLGAKELVLIGQDVSSWGLDLPGSETLADVVRAVAGLSGVRWLRLMYVQPDGITDELLSAIRDNPNVVRYLDMPLQHAAAPVLKRMRRSGDSKRFLALVERVRNTLPDVTLRTTLIAGFPGETRADAAELLRFVDDARFDYVGVFPYSAEEGTPAAEMPDHVPRRTILARAQRLRDAADRIGFERAAEHVGETLEVLVEGWDGDEESIVGRWRGQAPEIDGLVLLDRGEAGEIVSACIVDSFGYDLLGKVEA